MRRIILLFLISMLGVSLVSAQNIKRWSVGAAFATGVVFHDYSYGNSPKGSALVPSLFYNISSNRSVGISLLLPLANEDTEYSHSYTTGLELSFKQDVEILPKFKISLYALGMFGVTGPYKAITGYMIGGNPKYNTTRWLVGIRPNISYHITPNWSVNLGYGFLGYMSDNDIDETIVENSGKWGFNDEMGWGNSLRVGVSYSF